MFLGENGPKMGPKWGFSGFNKNQGMEFVFFACNYSSMKTENWLKLFSREKFCFEVFRAKGATKLSFSRFMKSQYVQHFFLFLALA